MAADMCAERTRFPGGSMTSSTTPCSSCASGPAVDARRADRRQCRTAVTSIRAEIAGLIPPRRHAPAAVIEGCRAVPPPAELAVIETASSGSMPQTSGTCTGHGRSCRWLRPSRPSMATARICPTAACDCPLRLSVGAMAARARDAIKPAIADGRRRDYPRDTRTPRARVFCAIGVDQAVPDVSPSPAREVQESAPAERRIRR